MLNDLNGLALKDYLDITFNHNLKLNIDSHQFSVIRLTGKNKTRFEYDLDYPMEYKQACALSIEQLLTIISNRVKK